MLSSLIQWWTQIFSFSWVHWTWVAERFTPTETYIFPASFWIWEGATNESGGTCLRPYPTWQAVVLGTGQTGLTLYGWKGNRRPGGKWRPTDVRFMATSPACWPSRDEGQLRPQSQCSQRVLDYVYLLRLNRTNCSPVRASSRTIRRADSTQPLYCLM